MLLAFGVFFGIGVHSSSPWIRTLVEVFMPGYWVVVKAFPPGPEGYASLAADVGAALAMYVVDATLYGSQQPSTRSGSARVAHPNIAAIHSLEQAHGSFLTEIEH
jgi:hypothetical protein